MQNQLETEIGDDEDSDDDDDADDGMVGVAGGGWESVTTEQIVASQVKIFYNSYSINHTFISV